MDARAATPPRSTAAEEPGQPVTCRAGLICHHHRPWANVSNNRLMSCDQTVVDRCRCSWPVTVLRPARRHRPGVHIQTNRSNAGETPGPPTPVVLRTASCAIHVHA